MDELTIWKWTVAVADEPTICQIPEGAQIGMVEQQGDDLCFWAYCDATAEKIDVPVYVYGTGHRIPSGQLWVGSCQVPPFVWHLFIPSDIVRSAGLGVQAFMMLQQPEMRRQFDDQLALIEQRQARRRGGLQ